MADTLHTISVIAVVLLRRKRQAADELRRLRDRIYDLNRYETFLLEYHDIDLALSVCLCFGDFLDRIVDGISENCIKIHRVHERKLRSVSHTIYLNPLLCADKALLSQDGIKDLAAGLHD